jgi:hypothetical protein
MPVLFLSHSGSDTEAAKALKRRIEDSPSAKKAELKVWFDKDDLKAGKSWQAQLAATIEKEADAFAVLLGARGIVNWVEAEVEVALSRATTSAFPFIPIIAKESQGSSALPAFARRYQGVLDPLNDSDELAKLIKATTGDWDREVILTDEPFVSRASRPRSMAVAMAAEAAASASAWDRLPICSRTGSTSATSSIEARCIAASMNRSSPANCSKPCRPSAPPMPLPATCSSGALPPS